MLSFALLGGLFAETPAPVIRQPRVTKSTDCGRTAEARKAGVEGLVLLRGIVDEQGHLVELRVTRGIGYGLDERALSCVQQWQFAPGTRDGSPTRIPVSFEIGFRSLN